MINHRLNAGSRWRGLSTGASDGMDAVGERTGKYS